jgi:tetratricopeptide (TPR) repeat protein
MRDLNVRAAQRVLGLAYEQNGNIDLAINEFQQRVKAYGPGDDINLPLSIAELAHAYAVSGRRKQALQLLSELTALSKRRFVDPWAIALVHAGLADKDRAFEWLERAYEEPSGATQWLLKTDPRMDLLRSDPRFQELLRRMGLPLT